MAFLYTNQVADYMMAAFTPNLTAWGLNGIYEYDNDLTPDSPALLVIGMPRERTYHGAHLFKIQFHIVMFVVSANLNISKSARQAACEATSDQIVAFLDADQSLGGNIIQGWVERDVGGSLTVKPGSVWVGHRIEWIGEQRQVVN